MKIHVYTICYNEAKLLPFFIRHYQQFAEKIVFYDNESTDNSKAIIESSDKCFYKSYSSGNEIRDDIYRKLKNDMWKESRGEADFVIIVDLDEFVYSKDMLSYLKRMKKLNVALIRPRAFDMITDEFNWNSESQITQMVNSGYRNSGMFMDKPCIFNPNRTSEINYTTGAHSCGRKGSGFGYGHKGIPQFFGKFYMLHYKFLTLDNVIERNTVLKNRLSAKNKQKGHGAHYLKDDVSITNDFKNNLKMASRVF
jgi:hypothetical protein